MKRKSWLLKPSVIKGVLKGSPMHIITRKRLNEFAEKHPDTESALANWYRLMKRNNFSSFVELREVFPAADQVGKLKVFNVVGTRFA